jgi:hypothetical protein
MQQDQSNQPDQSNVYRLTKIFGELKKLNDPNKAYFLEFTIGRGTAFIVSVGDVVESIKPLNSKSEYTAYVNTFNITITTEKTAIGTYLGEKVTNDIKDGDYFLRVEDNTMDEIQKIIPDEKTCAFAYKITDINKEKATAQIQKFINVDQDNQLYRTYHPNNNLETQETVTFPGFEPIEQEIKSEIKSDIKPESFFTRMRNNLTGKKIGGKRNRNTKKPKRKNRRKSRKN